MSDRYGARLFDQHQEVLRTRAVPPDVADERGYVSVDGVAQLRRLGFTVGTPPLPALLIPRFNVDGDVAAPQLRPDRPRVTSTGKERKYEAPVGAGNFLDVHPRCRPTLAAAAVPLVVSCEGTLKADALLAHLGAGHCVVSIPGVTCWRGTVGDAGAKTTTALADWHDVALRGRLVHLACDSDYAGNDNVRRAVAGLARYLESKGAGVRVVFPDAGPDDAKAGWDDYLAGGGSWAARLAELEPVAGKPDEAAGHKRSQADELVILADAADLFHDPNGDAFARLDVGDHRELWPVRSRGFRRWLVAGYYATTGKAPNAEALAAALAVAEARAAFEGPEEDVHLRVAPDAAGGLWLDLGREDWDAVHVTPDGWELVPEPPVNLWRPPALGALPVPEPGGDLDGLWKFVNIAEDDRPLVRAWLTAAMWPLGPYPLLAEAGEQGTAKTTNVRVLRRLIDPARPEVRRPPRSERDLGVATRHCWLLAFDNLGSIPDWFSDALCVLSTGGGFATRSLYSDADEVVFDARRPVLLTGIVDVVDAPDLADRAIAVTCPPIPEDKRKEETDLWAAFDVAAPKLLGALLDEVAAAAARLPETKLEARPRMADFARLAVAAETARGAEPRFLAAYSTARRRAAVDTLESNVVGPLLVGAAPFTGSAAELLERIVGAAPEGTTKRADWPKSARGMAGLVRRLAPALRAAGRTVEFTRESHTGKRLIRISLAAENTPKEPSPPSPSSDLHFSGDGGDGSDEKAAPTVTRLSPGETTVDLREHISGDGGDGGDDCAAHLSADTSEPESCAVCGSAAVYIHEHDTGRPLCQPCVMAVATAPAPNGKEPASPTVQPDPLRFAGHVVDEPACLVCGELLVRKGRGRPPVYCSPACRTKAQRARARR